MRINNLLKIIFLIILIGCIGSAAYFKWVTSQAESTTFYQNSEEIKFAKQEDYTNYIVLEKNQAVLMLGQSKTNLGYTGLSKTLVDELTRLQVHEFNIIITKESDYKQVVSVLDVMTQAKIRKYTLLKS